MLAERGQESVEGLEEGIDLVGMDTDEGRVAVAVGGRGADESEAAMRNEDGKRRGGNAWHARMREMLVAALEKVESNDAIRAIIMTGTGERAFCAGQDLNETKTFDPDRAEEWIKEWDRLYNTIRGLSKPLIMALNGLAAGRRI